MGTYSQPRFNWRSQPLCSRTTVLLLPVIMLLNNSAIATFDIAKEALPDFLLHIQQGKVQIPDLQRSFCWSDELVIELLASISLGWPVGAIMLLEQGNADWSFRPRPIEGR